MSVTDIILDIEARLRPTGASVARICREADIDRSTWHRWKAGGDVPRGSTWEKVRGALEGRIGSVPALPSGEAGT